MSENTKIKEEIRRLEQYKKSKAKCVGIAIEHLDLFSGIGGFYYGIRNALDEINQNSEHQTPFQLNTTHVEIKPTAIQFIKNNIDQKFDGCNIKKLNLTENDGYEIDILTAGFPCQPFSIAGNKGGFNDKHGRGNMFFYIVDILKLKRPPLFILENVENLLHHDNGNTMKTICQLLSEIDYQFDYHVFNALDFGLPQNRKRVFIFGIDKKLRIPLAKVASTFYKIKEHWQYTQYKPTYFDNIIEDNAINEVNLTYNNKNIQFQKDIKEYLINNGLTIFDLIGKNMNDKRGGNNNIHSWQLSLPAKLKLQVKDANLIEKYYQYYSEFLNFILLSCRKKNNDEYKTGRPDHIPLTLSIIEQEINKYKTDHDDLSSNIRNLNILKDFQQEIDINTEDTVKILLKMGYLTKHQIKQDEKTKKLSWEKCNCKCNRNRNQDNQCQDKSQISELPYQFGYTVNGGRLSFVYNQFIGANKYCVLKTLTATDASKIGIIEKQFVDINPKNLPIPFIRPMTDKEMLGSLGFPINKFQISFDNITQAQRYDLIGNSIAVPIATWIANQLLLLIT